MFADVQYIMWCMKLLFIKWCLVESTIILELIFSTHQISSCGFLSTFFQLAKYDAVILTNVAIERFVSLVLIFLWLIYFHKFNYHTCTGWECVENIDFIAWIVVGSMLIANLTMLTLTLLSIQPKQLCILF